MKICQGYKGSYIKDPVRKLQLIASAFQWKKFNPEDRLVLYCPREDAEIAFDFKTGEPRPWDDICVIPDETVYKLYDTGRYEIMSIQDEDFGWLDPDTLTFEKVPNIVPGKIDFIGYGNEGNQGFYPKRQEKWLRDFMSKFSYNYNYEEKAYNMGFFKTTAELGVIMGIECRKALEFFIKQGVTYWEPSDVRLHHFCSQAVPALVIDRFHRNYKELNSFYPNLGHPVVWHLVQPFTVMSNGDKLWSSKRNREKVAFWRKVVNFIIDCKGITWEEFNSFYLEHKDDSLDLV